ncbi:MAG: hypothetical protein WAN12_02755 [Candidatus Acidiferrum sp.]
MKILKRLHNTLWGVLFTSLLLLGSSSATRKPSPQAWGEVVSGLQISIYLDQAEGVQSNAPKFRVEFRNAGEFDLILNLGTMLANGKKQHPNAVVLTLTDARGKSRRLDLLLPGIIAGRVDPLIVPIPVGAMFSIPVDLEKYWAATSGEFDCKLKPGNYSLQAEFAGKGVGQQEANLDVQGIALMPYWTGRVTSNHLQFEVSSR